MAIFVLAVRPEARRVPRNRSERRSRRALKAGSEITAPDQRRLAFPSRAANDDRRENRRGGRVSVGRRPFVSQNTPRRTGADSRTIPTELNAREPLRPSNSQGGSKQVAESGETRRRRPGTSEPVQIRGICSGREAPSRVDQPDVEGSASILGTQGCDDAAREPDGVLGDDC
jgi:hypothetical protein